LEALGARLISERMEAGEFERFLARLVPLPEPRSDRTDGGRVVRNVERVREAIRTANCSRPSSSSPATSSAATAARTRVPTSSGAASHATRSNTPV